MAFPNLVKRENLLVILLFINPRLICFYLTACPK